jgi:hypothetical protein
VRETSGGEPRSSRQPVLLLSSMKIASRQLAHCDEGIREHLDGRTLGTAQKRSRSTGAARERSLPRTTPVTSSGARLTCAQGYRELA